MRLLRIALALFAVILFPALALAAEPLTGKQVEGFIAVAPELEKLGTEHAEEFDGEAFQTLNPKAIVEALEAAGIAKDYEALVQKHGFSSAFQAADVMRRVMTAFMVSSGNVDPRADLKQAREQIAADKNIGEDEREAILKDLEATEAAFADVEADKPIIQPYLEQLEGIFGAFGSGEE